MASQMNEIRRRMHEAQGDLNYSLEVFGDELARRSDLGSHKGMDAVWFYLVQKHGWLPRDVKAMSPEDLRWTLEVEMSGWTLPPDALR